MKLNNRKRIRSLSLSLNSLFGSSSSVGTNSTRLSTLSTSVPNLNVSPNPSPTQTNPGNQENAINQLLKQMQSRKEKYGAATMWGIFAMGIVGIIAGLSALIVEIITTLKYPNASAALLSVELIGIAVGTCTALQGMISILSWKLNRCGHKNCLMGMIRSLCSLILLGSFFAFCLSLIAFGIYTTLESWQRKVSPFLDFTSKIFKKFGREDLGFPKEFMEELVVLKAATFSCHLVIFIATGATWMLCFVSGYISDMPDFGVYLRRQFEKC